MDNSELHYLTYDPEAIWAEMMLAYVNAGGDVLWPGDEKEMLLRSVQADIVQVFAAVDNALRMQTLRYAVGEYLDILGEQRGCTRIQATAARAKVVITTNATGRSDTLPAGTAMTSDGEVFYLLEEALPLTGYVQSLIAEVVADRTGSRGNALTDGAQMQLAVSHEAVSSIVSISRASGGNEREEDEAFRERIREYGLASATTGPSSRYEAVAKAVSSQIIDAKALNIGAGEVGVYVLLADPTGAVAILEAVENALSADDVRPLTDQVFVYLVTDVDYTLNVNYCSDGSNSTNAAIAAAVSEYQQWQENTIGQAFNPDRLMAALYQAGATRVQWGEGSGLHGDRPEYSEIEQTERCKGIITLTRV